MLKRYWGTILMAAVLAGLGAYVSFVELPTERTRTETEAAAQKILPFEDRDVTTVTVRTGAGEVALTRGEKQAWNIAAPIRTEADSREVDGMLRALTLGRVSRVVEDKAAALAPFGLEKPSVVLTLTAGSRRETLSLGDSGPISSTLYAMRDSDRQVLLTDLTPKDFLNKTVHTFRKKEVLHVEEGAVERVRLTYPSTEIVLYRTDHRKKWKVRFPIEAEADQIEVRGLLLKLHELKALGFVDPGPDRDALATRLRKPDVKITLHTAGADQTVKLFTPAPASGEAYAVTVPDAPIYRISPATIKDLTKDLFTLQDKRLLGLDRDEVAKLAVKTREEEYVLANRNGTWVLEDQPQATLNQELADLLVSRAVNLPAELRVVKQTGPLAPYGLVSPTAEFTALHVDGKTTGRLALGTRAGGLVYAIGQRLRGIYQARADLLSQIPAKRDLLTKAGPTANSPSQ